MKLRTELMFRSGPVSVALAVAAQTLAATPASIPAAPAASVPFVGCASSGQVALRDAPTGTNRSVPISPAQARALAYYRSADGIGVLAPRGWYCQGLSGSGGHTLFLSPNPIRHSLLGWHGIEGTAIEINFISGENSGRFEMAEIVARLFPSYKAFASQVWKTLDIPLPSGPFPHDTLKYRSRAVVEYQTPAQTKGLGNFDLWLKQDRRPIAGAAILVGDPLDPHRILALVILSVRFPPELRRLVPAIVRYAESDVVAAHP